MTDQDPPQYHDPSYPGQSYPGQPDRGQPYQAEQYPTQQYPAQPYPAPQYQNQPYQGQQGGYAPPAHAYAYPQPPTGANGLCVAGFVCGLIGLIFCWIPGFGIVLALLGVILGGAGMSQARRTNSGAGLGIAGLVLGIIALIPAVLVLVAVANS